MSSSMMFHNQVATCNSSSSSVDTVMSLCSTKLALSRFLNLKSLHFQLYSPSVLNCKLNQELGLLELPPHDTHLSTETKADDRRPILLADRFLYDT